MGASVRTDLPPSLVLLLATKIVWKSMMVQALERVKLDEAPLKLRHTHAE